MTLFVITSNDSGYAADLMRLEILAWSEAQAWEIFCSLRYVDPANINNYTIKEV